MHEATKAIEAISSLLNKLLMHLSTDTTATIVSGIVVFVLCEYIKEIWLMPLQEYKKLKSEGYSIFKEYKDVYKKASNEKDNINLYSGIGMKKIYDNYKDKV